MKSFFKIFFASFLALVVFTVIGIFAFRWFITQSVESQRIHVEPATVLVIDLSKPLMEQTMDADVSFPGGQTPSISGLFDVVRAIQFAKKDSAIKGIYIKCAENANGFASSEELRNALIDFKQSKKFVIAYANYISQKSYYVASVADRLYCNPQGMLDWRGFSMVYPFLKGALDKLEVKPEIFYAGQFKSATEPLREKQMTPANRLQSLFFLNELYSMLLLAAADKTGTDTAVLHQYANEYTIRSATDALKNKLIDDVKYDDEVKAEIQSRIGLKSTDKIPFISVADYIKSADWNATNSESKIALIYAQGDIVDGQGKDDEIGGDRYVALLRKARLDKNIKAVVLRINSGGGSSMASEMIWREVTITRKEKPVVVSMGDYAASGGYYIACNADSIFAQPNTLTGSIGVFSIYGDVSGLMVNKLGITFDGVKTSSFADFGNLFRGMTNEEKKIAQANVDSIYAIFKVRVAAGRKMPDTYVDSVAQGRIWSGKQALKLKLVDRLGNIGDAIVCAANMSKLKNYQLKELPAVQSFWDKLLHAKNNKVSISTMLLDEQLDQESTTVLKQVQQVKSWFGQPQARLPFFIEIK